jgi:hypothetical protein
VESKNKWWKTESIYVDVDTGEIINRKNVTNKEYRKIDKKVNYGRNKSKTITYECKWNGQEKFF